MAGAQWGVGPGGAIMIWRGQVSRSAEIQGHGGRKAARATPEASSCLNLAKLDPPTLNAALGRGPAHCHCLTEGHSNVRMCYVTTEHVTSDLKGATWAHAPK
jgi:hypothetical protein